MTQFETVTKIIIEAAKSSYPEWKTFEVKDDFLTSRSHLYGTQSKH